MDMLPLLLGNATKQHPCPVLYKWQYTYNNNYNLRAVVVHLGAIDSGHYVTYRRESEMIDSLNETTKPRWFFTSDSVVREVTLDEVLNTNPYMLFYEKE